MTSMAADAGDRPRKRGDESEATFIRGTGSLRQVAVANKPSHLRVVVQFEILQKSHLHHSVILSLSKDDGTVVAAVGSTADRHPADGGYPKDKTAAALNPHYNRSPACQEAAFMQVWACMKSTGQPILEDATPVFAPDAVSGAT